MQTGRLFRGVYRVTLVLFLSLLVTGMYLVFFYRPTAAAAWSDIYELKANWALGAFVQSTHRWVSFLMIPMVATLALLGLFETGFTLRNRRTAAVLLPVLAVAGVLTGFVLPWDQLALQSVTVGTNISGYAPVFGDEVRFVLTDGWMIGKGFLAAALIVHTLVIGSLFVGVFVFVRTKRDARLG